MLYHQCVMLWRSLCVVVSIDRSLGYKGLTMFLVDAHLPRYQHWQHEDKMGIRRLQPVMYYLRDGHIPASALIGAKREKASRSL